MYSASVDTGSDWSGAAQGVRDYVIQRVLAIFPVLGIVAIVTFSLIHIVPGDPATILGGDQATEEDIARIKERMGLDKPLYVQFGIWFGNLLQGDLGVSPASKYPVGKQIRQRLAPTISIGIYALGAGHSRAPTGDTVGVEGQ